MGCLKLVKLFDASRLSALHPTTPSLVDQIMVSKGFMWVLLTNTLPSWRRYAKGWSKMKSWWPWYYPLLPALRPSSPLLYCTASLNRLHDCTGCSMSTTKVRVSWFPFVSDLCQIFFLVSVDFVILTHCPVLPCMLYCWHSRVRYRVINDGVWLPLLRLLREWSTTLLQPLSMLRYAGARATGVSWTSGGLLQTS